MDNFALRVVESWFTPWLQIAETTLYTLATRLRSHFMQQRRYDEKTLRKVVWEEAIKKPSATTSYHSELAIKTQRLRSCPSVIQPGPVIILLFLTSSLFLPLGGLLLASSQRAVRVEKRYDDVCPEGSEECVFDMIMELEKEMEPPVYFYYRLTNFYQNYRRYASSYSPHQLRGEVVDTSYLSACDPLTENDEGDIYNPCGLLPWSVFNDTFDLFALDGRAIVLDDADIAWPADDRRFRDPFFDVDDQTRILDSGVLIRSFEDPRFKEWVRYKALPNFVNLYGVIDERLPAGSYRVRVRNSFPTRVFSGEKYVVLETSTWSATGSNSVMAIAYLVTGAVMFLLAAAFSIAQLTRPVRSADPRFQAWAAENKPVIRYGRIRAARDIIDANNRALLERAAAERAAENEKVGLR